MLTLSMAVFRWISLTRGYDLSKLIKIFLKYKAMKAIYLCCVIFLNGMSIEARVACTSRLRKTKPYSKTLFIFK